MSYIMLLLTKLKWLYPIQSHFHRKLKPAYYSHAVSESTSEFEKIFKLINDHPFPGSPLQPTFFQHIPLAVLSPTFVNNLLGRLFSTHSNGLKAFEFFKFTLHYSKFIPSPDAFEKTIHILSRMRYFDKAWELMDEIKQTHPSLITVKSMSIMLSKIAKFQSYEDTVRAFDRMEKVIFFEREFGIDEFNAFLRAFCAQGQMKEARSVFRKMHSRFSPNMKTMNILLWGFKESGDITAIELFYHEMVRRGFKPDSVTYNIRIDGYCKDGCFADGLRLFKQMEQENCMPSLQTITTLIKGAGIVRNSSKAWQMFEEFHNKNIHPDIGAYNALISSLIRSRDMKSAVKLMNQMEECNIGFDSETYHSMFFGLIHTNGIEGVCELYCRMMKSNLVPKTRTVVMLMKFFCLSSRPDLGLNLWCYLSENGYCPHGHALDILVTALCSRGCVREAFECCMETLKRGRHISEGTFRMLERFLVEKGKNENLRKLDERIKGLRAVFPSSKGLASGLSVNIDTSVVV